MTRWMKLVGFSCAMLWLVAALACLLFGVFRDNASPGAWLLVLLALAVFAARQAILRLTITSDELIVRSPFGVRHYRRAELIDWRKEFDLERNGAPARITLAFEGRPPLTIVEEAFACQRDEILLALDRWIGITQTLNCDGQ